MDMNRRKDPHRHKATMYWAIRSVLPGHGYEPVDVKGRVSGFTVCLPEVARKIDHKRRKDYARHSNSHQDRLPIWC